MAGQVIWSSRFLGVGELRARRRQGRRRAPACASTATRSASHRALRGRGIAASADPGRRAGSRSVGLTFRLHPGNEDQLPDPLIEAIEGEAPAYRGTAYVVFENLDLTPYGNRIPQFNFEVFRRPPAGYRAAGPPALDVRGVALVPGSGEYALATERCTSGAARGDNGAEHSQRSGVPDIPASLDQLVGGTAEREVDLAGGLLVRRRPALRPLHAAARGRAGGRRRRADALGRVRSRAARRRVVSTGGRPPDLRWYAGRRSRCCRRSRACNASGRSVMFYPFILMDIRAGTGSPIPGPARADQPPVPWRGRITLAQAPGQAGSSDKTPAAAAEVATFFGEATGRRTFGAGQTVELRRPGGVVLSTVHPALRPSLRAGRRRRCLLHRVGDARPDPDPRPGHGYPAVRALTSWPTRFGRSWGRTPDRLRRRLVGVLRSPAGDGSGDVLYNLDPLWATPAIDFIGIDNYMPLSDWRDGTSHADAAAGSIYNLDYLNGERRGRRRATTGTTPTPRGMTRRSASDQRRGLRRGLGLSLQGSGGLVVEPARQPAGGVKAAVRRPGSRGRSRYGSPSLAVRR